jgi:hypothetical protein
MSRRKPPEPAQPDLPPERVIVALRRQLTELGRLRGRHFQEARGDESQWQNLTENLVTRGFGENSTNLRQFYAARSAGEHYMTPYGMSDAQLQHNFEERILHFEGVLNSCIAELEFVLPQNEIKGAYEPSEEYAFYRDLKMIIRLAQREILVVDNYLDTQLFDIYVEQVEPAVAVGVLTDELRGSLVAVAQKYAARGNFELRTSKEVHDRVVFADDRCWVIGQSIKDAAKKKPTYIVEHSAVIMRPIYDDIWNRAAQVVKS